jgi:hypothetical protein
LFVTSGGLEPDIAVTTKGFSQRLDSLKPAFAAFQHRYYAEDSHGLTPAPSLVDGLRFIFEPISITKLPIAMLGPGTDSAAAMNAFIESKRRYAIGARSLGLAEKFPESETNQLGYAVLQITKHPALAVWLFRQNAELYPESANVYDSLGDGLLAMGDSTAAEVQFRRAVTVATRTKHRVLEESRKKLKALEAARKKP